MRRTWSAYFQPVARAPKHRNDWKTTQATQITWTGVFDGQIIRIVSTVRLTLGNLAHFVVNSGARIGAHDWNLPGGHYIDLKVYSTRTLSDEQLRELGQLAGTEDERPIYVRRAGERLRDAIAVPRLPKSRCC
jgi:hypothetical protein